MTSGGRPVSVLLVCTANQGRSAMAEALLRARLGGTGLEHGVLVGSAGLLEGGVAASQPVLDAVRPFGGDLSRHRSRQVSGELVDAADLVVAMAGEHARAVAQLREGARERTFTLKELVRPVEADRPRQPDEELSSYLRRLATRREASSEAWSDGNDDVADPYGRPVEAVAETAGEIDDLLQRLVAHLWPGR